VLNALSEHPEAWNFLRGVVEDGFQGEKKVIARELDPWRDVGQRTFLDFGCGTGQFAACFPPACYVGMDPAVHYVRYAARARPGSFFIMDGTILGLQSASFDAALVLGVFHHLPDAMVRASVGELHRVLRPGATLLVMEDIEPPPESWNIPGRVMHWLDRGAFIRDDDDYRALFDDRFDILRTYTTRSGICDYRVYILSRSENQLTPA
jgi:SAM-dependent methyltransferase